MINLKIKKIKHLIKRISDDFQENQSVSIVAKYEVAVGVISELVKQNYGIFSIELEPPMEGFDDWYNDEYVIEIYDDCEFLCYKMKDDKKKEYLSVSNDVVYLFDDCNCKTISHIDTDNLYEVELVEDFSEEKDSEKENNIIKKETSDKSNKDSVKAKIDIKINDKVLSEEETAKYLVDAIAKHFTSEKRINNYKEDIDAFDIDGFIDDLIDVSSLIRSYRDFFSF